MNSNFGNSWTSASSCSIFCFASLGPQTKLSFSRQWCHQWARKSAVVAWHHCIRSRRFSHSLRWKESDELACCLPVRSTELSRTFADSTTHLIFVTRRYMIVSSVNVASGVCRGRGAFIFKPKSSNLSVTSRNHCRQLIHVNHCRGTKFGYFQHWLEACV